MREILVAASQLATAIEYRPPMRVALGEYKLDLKRAGRLTPLVEESIYKAEEIRQGHELIFYIAGALTGVDKATKARYGQLSNLITTYRHPEKSDMFGYAPHLHGTDPVEHPNVTPQEVRDVDYLWATVMPDCHFNFMDPIAHGNAIEAGWAEESRIPSVHFVPTGMVTSRLVRGLTNTLVTFEYENFEDDGLYQVERFVHAVHNNLGDIATRDLPRSRYLPIENFR